MESSISWSIFIIATAIQAYFLVNNIKKLSGVRNFFNKKINYEVLGNDENSQLNPDVAIKDSHLYDLINELNEYTRRNHGTADFSVIQNKTDRKIKVLYDEASSRIAFPTYIGLMGTFLGVFIGLLFFSYGLNSSTDGITDATIGNLISGVLVSMSTSFIGLLLTTITNGYAAETQRIVGADKNDFYEFVQNELMPTLGVSMVVALNKLHHTINLFEPSFNRVIDRFQSTFDNCTQRFGNAFEQNVVVVSEAVRVMGENMDKINDNVDLQEKLLTTLKSRGVVDSLNAFVRAAQNFDLVTTALNRFEVSRNAIKDATVELINSQRRYNESLEIPLSVANKLNMILNRVTEFEKSINALGRSIEKTDLIANTEVEALKEAIKAIKKKQKIAVEAMEVSDGHLENIFKMQSDSIKRLGKVYEESIASYAEKFENVLEGLGKELQDRRKEIVDAIEEKFSLEQIQQEFSQLSKLKKIEELLSSINTKSSREEVDKTIESTRREVENIRKLLDKAMEESKQQKTDTPQNSSGGFLGSIFGRK